MPLITTTSDLAAFCEAASRQPFVTVDTEFMRERTYFAQLCLLQMAMPGTDDSTAVLVDTLAPGLDLAPVLALFRHPGVVKVFHAARQDVEIFWQQSGVIPAPFFDTQVAAMVCGFGDQAGYETLVRQITRGQIDKSSRFTDWSQRPLNDKQLAYARADVTFLRDVYLDLRRRLEKAGRLSWLDEEMAVLTDPETYTTRPEEAWMRIRTRTTAPKFLAQVKELARFREELAVARNVPRARILKDDALLELAALKPRSSEDLAKARLLRDGRKGEVAEGILAAVARALAMPAGEMPHVEEPPKRKPGSEGLADLLRVLLKARAEAEGVAQRLIASSADLDALASGAADLPALHGWRHDVFGADALRLIAGEIALSAGPEGVKTVALQRSES
jgi:ribonuclease D